MPLGYGALLLVPIRRVLGDNLANSFFWKKKFVNTMILGMFYEIVLKLIFLLTDA